MYEVTMEFCRVTYVESFATAEEAEVHAACWYADMCKDATDAGISIDDPTWPRYHVQQVDEE